MYKMIKVNQKNYLIIIYWRELFHLKIMKHSNKAIKMNRIIIKTVKRVNKILINNQQIKIKFTLVSDQRIIDVQ